MKTETQTPASPFFAKALEMGRLQVKTRIKAGRKQEQNDK
jgi:hypothetical protein